MLMWINPSKNKLLKVQHVCIMPDPQPHRQVDMSAEILSGFIFVSSFVAEDTYERTLTVDGEETTLIVMDTWENDKMVQCFAFNVQLIIHKM